MWIIHSVKLLQGLNCFLKLGILIDVQVSPCQKHQGISRKFDVISVFICLIIENLFLFNIISTFWPVNLTSVRQLYGLNHQGNFVISGLFW